MIIDNFVEKIFSNAVALEQSGRFKNIIYCMDDKIYIRNFDNTVLLKFELNSKKFDKPVSFKANEYDSKKFYVDKDNRVVFELEEAGFVRRKICSSQKELTVGDIDKLYSSYLSSKESNNFITLSSSILNLLEENLSHVEFSSNGNNLRLIQRNIYDGSTIELRKSEKGFGALIREHLKKDFKLIAIRTIDLFSLFSFQDNITFYFQDETKGYCIFVGNSPKQKMEGILSYCLYDEMGEILNIQEE